MKRTVYKKPKLSVVHSKASKPVPLKSAKGRSSAKMSVITLDSKQVEYLKKNPQGKSIRFNSIVAIRYDINVAIVFNNIAYWYNENVINKANFEDGYYWTYNSVSGIRSFIPFMSERSITLAIKKLRGEGLVIKAKKNYNKHGYDKTSWYRLDEKLIKSTFKISVNEILYPA